MIKIQEKVSLKELTTFQIGGQASYFSVVKNEDELWEIFSYLKTRRLPFFVLGGGSNLLFSDRGYSGLIIKNEIKGIKFSDQENGEVILEAGAGEILDEIIALSVARNLSGLENLSGIPGTVGGATVQNAGAYGTEIKETIFLVEGFNSVNGKKFSFGNSDCQFNYRDSIFKKNKKFIITAVFFRLKKKKEFNLSYVGLKERLANEKDITVGQIRDAVLQIRQEKLPDWHALGTAGSFFKNPIISKDKYEAIKVSFPTVPGFADDKNQIKVPLAWILDNICHLKGYKEGPVGLYEKQPLILVNFGQATCAQVTNFSDKVKKIVKEKTDIDIEEEVEKIIF